MRSVFMLTRSPLEKPEVANGSRWLLFEQERLEFGDLPVPGAVVVPGRGEPIRQRVVIRPDREGARPQREPHLTGSARRLPVAFIRDHSRVLRRLTARLRKIAVRGQHHHLVRTVLFLPSHVGLQR